MSSENRGKTRPLHIAMFPLFAMSHFTSFLNLANKLAENGNRVSFFVPSKTQPKLTSYNHHPHLITFIPITVPHVEGLPDGVETSTEVHIQVRPLIKTAMDRTQDIIETHLASLRPDFVLHDFAYWVPGLARKLGIKSVYFAACYMGHLAYISYKARNLPLNYQLKKADLVSPPLGFPNPEIRLQAHEARALAEACNMVSGDEGLTLWERYNMAIKECEAIGVKTCRDMEEAYVNYFEKHFDKPVLLTGPLIPKPPNSSLDEGFENWLNGFDNGSVVYCALGSEWVLQKEQVQELLLGLELTGRPFLAALKTPEGCETIESAIPEGLSERTKTRGMVHGGWVQQQLIIQHPSVGCFVTHCGAGSLSEAIGSNCQLVMMPLAVDQYINARILSLELKIGVEVEKKSEEDGLFTKESVYKAIEMVMEEESQVGSDVRANHAYLRDVLFKEELQHSNYITAFIRGLYNLLE